jgi:AcrR family transcriptional regulator
MSAESLIRRAILKGAIGNDADIFTMKKRSKTRERYRRGEDRAREILDAAMELFAEEGFATSLQRIADHIGVTQPLLHRYFPTKMHLIEAVKKELLQGHWRPEWHRILTDRSRPLLQRLCDFYADYLPLIYRRTWYRGFILIALENGDFAQIYLRKVSRELLGTVLAETRSEFGLPDLTIRPIQPRELELVWGMHSTFVFIGMRHFLYNMPLPEDLAAVIRDQASGYLRSAEVIMPELTARARSRKPAS